MLDFLGKIIYREGCFIVKVEAGDPYLSTYLIRMVGKNQRYGQAAIRAQKNLVQFDDLRTGPPENLQENPILNAGYFFYRHTSEIGSFGALLI